MRTEKAQLAVQAKIDFPTELFPFGYFTNALCIPDRWGIASFDQNMAPKNRATNSGFLVVTIEHDCQTTAQLEEVFSSTGGGEFQHSRFAKVDRELGRFSGDLWSDHPGAGCR